MSSLAGDTSAQPGRRIHVALGIGLPALVLTSLISCDLVSPPLKDSLPTGHVDEIGGAFHNRNAEEPFLAPGLCAAYGCHHANLRGGWARVIDSRTGDIREARSPSCYQCHGRLWNTRYPELIQVFYPTSDVLWNHGKSRLVEWWGPETDSAAIYLYSDFTLVDTLLEMQPTDGVVRLESVETAWGTGEEFRVRIVQSSGHETFGEAFTICGADEGVQVTRPTSKTVVLQNEEMNVEWRCAAGVVVDILIYDGDAFLDVFRRDAGNSGFAGRPFPETWGTGTEYRIQVVDAEGVVGFSEPFEIRAAP